MISVVRMNTSQKTIWVVSELFYPEETSTGHYLTQIAAGVAMGARVKVLCSQPTYSQRGQRAPWREWYRGMEIIRCWSTTLNCNVILLRLLNLVTISVSIFGQAVWRFQKGDRVLVVTNPPLLPYVILLASWLRGATPVLLVHDVYPEVLGVFGRRSTLFLAFRIVDRLSSWLYRRMKRVVVIGRDMVRLVQRKGVDARRIEIITNWADLHEIGPMPRRDNPIRRESGIGDRFVVQYCGNMGRTHGLGDLVATARSLRDREDIHFMMVGSGARYAWLEQTVTEESLANVSVHPRRPRSDLCALLNACDLAVIALLPNMSGVSVPSRMYNVMAAGKPILAIADDDSELAMTVREQRIGWVVRPGDIDGVAAAIKKAASDMEALKGMGRRARRLAETRFNPDRIIEQYRVLFESFNGATEKPSAVAVKSRTAMA